RLAAGRPPGREPDGLRRRHRARAARSRVRARARSLERDRRDRLPRPQLHLARAGAGRGARPRPRRAAGGAAPEARVRAPDDVRLALSFSFFGDRDDMFVVAGEALMDVFTGATTP